MSFLIKIVTPIALFTGASTAFAWETGPTLNATAYSTGTTLYLGALGTNISTQSGYEGDIATLLRLNGTTTFSFFGQTGSAADFSKNIWIKLDSESNAKTLGKITLYGGANAKNVAGSIHVWLDGYNQDSDGVPITTAIYGSGNGAGHSVGKEGTASDVNVELTGASVVTSITGVQTGGTVWGNVGIGVKDGSNAGAVVGSVGTLKGNLNIRVANATTAAISGVTTTGSVGGNIDITVTGESTTAAITGMAGMAAVDGTLNISVTGTSSSQKAKIGGAVIGANVTNSVSGNLDGSMTLSLTNANMTLTGNSALVTGSTVSTGALATGDVSVYLDGVGSKTDGVISGAAGVVTGTTTTGAGSTKTTGDVLVAINNSFTGNVVGTNAGATGTNTVSGKLTINIADSTTGGVTATTGNVAGGVQIDIINSKTNAVYAADAGANVSGGANINLNDGSASTNVYGTNSTGVINGNLNIKIRDGSSAAAVYGINTTGTVKGNIDIDISGVPASDGTPATPANIGGAVYGVYANNTASGGVDGNVNVTLKDVKMTANSSIGGFYATSGNGTNGDNVAVNLDNVTTTASIYGVYATTGSASTAGDVTVKVANNSTTGSILGTNVSNTGTDTIGGALLIDVKNSTTGAITATGVIATTGANSVDKGITIDLSDSTVKGAISGGGATVNANGVTIILHNVNTAEGAAVNSVTGTAGSVKGGVTFNANDSRYTAFYATNASSVKNSIDGDVSVNLTGSTVFSSTQYFGGFTTNNAASESAISGNVTVNIDSTVAGGASSIYMGAHQQSLSSATLEGASTLNIRGAAGTNHFATYTGTIYGRYLNATGDIKYADVNFTNNFRGGFAGVVGYGTSGVGNLKIDSGSSVDFSRTSGTTHYINSIEVLGDLSVAVNSVAASTTKFMNAANTAGAAIKGSGTIATSASLATSVVEFSGDTSGFTGNVNVNSGVFSVKDAARFSSSTINIANGAGAAKALFSGSGTWDTGMRLTGAGTASFNGATFNLSAGQAGFTGTWDVTGGANVYLQGTYNSLITKTGSGALHLASGGLDPAETLTLSVGGGDVYLGGDIAKVKLLSGSLRFSEAGSELAGERTFDVSDSNGTAYALRASNLTGNLTMKANDLNGDFYALYTGNGVNASAILTGNLDYTRIGTASEIVAGSGSVIYGTNTVVTGNATIYYENMKTTNLTLISHDRGVAGVTTNGPQIGGDLNFTFNGGTVNGYLYIAPNADNITDVNKYARVNGNVNVVLGGKELSDGSFEVSKTPTKITDIVNIVPSYSTVGGNVHATIVSGTYGGDILVGPASGSVDGSTKLTILGGTFNGVVYAGGSTKGLFSTTKGGVELNVSGGTFNKDIYMTSSSFFKTVEGDVTANFGSLDNVVFKDGTAIRVGSSGRNHTINFNGSTGKFGASVDGFAKMVVSADSYVQFEATNLKVDADTIVFHVDSLDQNGKIGFTNGTLLATDFDILLADTFVGSVDAFLELVTISGNFMVPDVNVSLKWENGSDYDELNWRGAFLNGNWGIEFYAIPIPEPSTYAAILGLGALAFAVCRRKRK